MKDAKMDITPAEIIKSFNIDGLTTLEDGRIDMRRGSAQDKVLEIASSFAKTFSRASLEDLEVQICKTDKASYPLLVHDALKSAISRKQLEDVSKELGEQPGKVTVLVAMGPEAERMLPAEENPNGEDFVRRKIKHMSWLLNGLANISGELIFIDDGAGDGSGEGVQRIVDETELPAGLNVNVLWLQDGINAIDNGTASDNVERALKRLRSVDDSRKNGSLQYGFAHILDNVDPAVRQFIVTTDADSSYDLGQMGRHVHALWEKGVDMVTSTRRNELSVLELNASRDWRGKTMRYLREALFPQVPSDPQGGFKAYSVDTIRRIVESNIKEFSFSADPVFIAHAKTLDEIPVTCFDSPALTSTNSKTYWGILNRMIRLTGEMPEIANPDEQKSDEAKEIIGIVTGSEEIWVEFVERVRQKAETLPSPTDMNLGYLKEIALELAGNS